MRRASWGRFLEDRAAFTLIPSPASRCQDWVWETVVCGPERQPAVPFGGLPKSVPGGRRSGGWAISGKGVSVSCLSHPACLIARPPSPTLSVDGESAQVVLPGADITLVCVAPLSGVEFQLRRGEEVLLVPRASTSPDRIFFQLKAVASKDGGLYTCRYRLGDERTDWPWSADSEPAELLLSDGEPGASSLGRGRYQGTFRDCGALGQVPVPAHAPGLSFPV